MSYYSRNEYRKVLAEHLPLSIGKGPFRLLFGATVTDNGDAGWSWRNIAGDQVDDYQKDISEAEQSGEPGWENWRQDWEPIRTKLKGGAQRRAVGITVDRRASLEKHDSGYCDYDYLAALEALEEPESVSEREDDRRAQAFVDTAMERLEEARREMRRVTERADFRKSLGKQLRQVAVGDGDDEEEDEEKGMVYSVDLGSMRWWEGRVVCGDWSIDLMIRAGRARVSRNQCN